MSEYVRRNFARIIGLDVPEPLAAMYNRDYFRATWITTALDAGFWTAMRIRPIFLNRICSLIFSLYYLVCADQADEVVRKVRGKLSLEHMRVSWNKGRTAPLRWLTPMMTPKHLSMKYSPRHISIPRPKNCPIREPIDAWLYFDGPIKDIKNQDKIIMDIPGGGFVAMDPRCHDEKLIAWATKTGFPVVSLNYKKAPEYPYPYALEECYDAYYTIQETRGKIVGLSGEFAPKVLVSGDSAGGNLATAMTLKILQGRSDVAERKKHELPVPEALLLVYPALDLNMTSWLSDEQSALIKDPARSESNRGVVRRKTEDYYTLTRTPVPSDDELDDSLRMTPLKRNKKSNTPKDSPRNDSPPKHKSNAANSAIARTDFASPPSSDPKQKSRRLRTRLEMTSMISYFNDRILSPELLRGMVIMYVGEENRPDLATDFLLSPLRAPEEMLREFPKVYMLTGERDPLCDDTAIFEGRLRSAHLHKFQTRKDLGLIPERVQFDEKHHVEVEFIPGVSHGFLQFASIYHDGFRFIEMCSRWMKRAFVEAAEREAREAAAGSGTDYFSLNGRLKKKPTRQQSEGGESSDNEDRPLEMASLTMTSASRNKSKESSNPKAQRRSGRGEVKKKPFDGRLSPVLTRNNRSLQKLASAEHLIERRMDGLSIGLTGDDDRPKTPS
jgi:acetyl esterase/lipase